MSQRFSKLMHTDSVILKETSGWEEYFYQALRPWEHYVPVRSRIPVRSSERPVSRQQPSQTGFLPRVAAFEYDLFHFISFFITGVERVNLRPVLDCRKLLKGWEGRGVQANCLERTGARF